MSSFFSTFVLSFVPLFIVMDVIGNLPIVVSMFEGMTEREQWKLVNLAVLTAGTVGLVFLFFGRFILGAMHILVGEFAIAGGLILLVLSIRTMITGQFVDAIKEEMVAVVPIGTPLVVGPATITTLIFLTEFQKYSLWVVLIAFLLNLGITWVVFLLGNQITRFLGQGGLKAVSRVFNLILAAIGVSMIMSGIASLGLITLPKA